MLGEFSLLAISAHRHVDTWIDSSRHGKASRRTVNSSVEDVAPPAGFLMIATLRVPVRDVMRCR